MKTFFGVIAMALSSSFSIAGSFEKDIIETASGGLEITFIGHGSLMMKHGGKVIHIDPYGTLTDYGKLPKADLVLITHEHGDHLDPGALAKIRTPDTVVAANAASVNIAGVAIKNGDVQTIMGFRIEAVPAYNLVNMRANGQPYHPKGNGNGYVITFADKRIYVAGDTEDTPEMKALKNIDCAFLPVNLPYTMSPEMAADAAKAFKPKILYPYHFGDTDASRLVTLLKDSPGIEVRIRRMK